jgi:uncharacterized membrane protein
MTSSRTRAAPSIFPRVHHPHGSIRYHGTVDRAHTHGHHHGQSLLVDRARQGSAVRWILGAVTAIGLATLVGLVVWWPRGEVVDTGASLAGLSYPRGVVVDVAPGECITVELGVPADCDLVTVELTSGPDAGATVPVQVAAIDFGTPELSVGDHLILQHNPLAPPQYAYTFWEFQRELPLAVLTILFVAIVLVFGRWQGLRALSGLVVTFGIILWFLLPSLLRDQPAVAVAIVAASLIAFATLYLSHGVSLETTVALVGTMASLVVIATLAAVFVSLANLTGLSDADVQLLRVSAEALDPVGLLLAGTIIGALGVLDDVTVTQTFAVAELRAANSAMGARELYQRGVRVGREHIAATVNTLVLAYVGASLSLMLFFVQSERPIGQVLGQEAVAIEIVRTLVGSIGLVAAVPITTALAVVVSQNGPAPRPAAPDPATTGAGRSTDPQVRWDDFAPDDDATF